MEPTKEQIVAQYKKLPGDLQKLVVSEDLGTGIQLIGRDTGITPEQALDVEDEVVAILMGTSHPKDFIRNIQSKLNIDQEKARAIAERVNEEIFQPVRESLKLVHGIKDEAPMTPKPGEKPSVFKVLDSTQQAISAQPKTPTPPAAPKTPMPPVAPKPAGGSSVFPEMIVPPKINVEMAPKPPAPAQPQAPQNIFEQKLQGVFKMPKEETLVPPKSSSSAPPTPPRMGSVDPYRELPQ